MPTMTTQLSPALHYDFLSVSSTIVPDITDHGYTGVIRGDATGGALMERAQVFGKEKPVLTLKGGSAGGYLQLPDGVADSKDGLTVSFFCCIHEAADPGCVFSLGEDACFYLLCSPVEEDAKSVALFPALTTGGLSQAQGFRQTFQIKKGQWFHLTLTLDSAVPSTCRIYLDGRQIGTFSHRRQSSLALWGATLCCFGYGTFADEPIAACYTDIRIFHRALADKEAEAVFSILPESRFKLEENVLAPLFEKPLTSSLTLPLQGSYGCTFAWSSSRPDVLANDGTVCRPEAGTPDLPVTLSVCMTYQDHTFQTTFHTIVPARPQDTEIADEDLNNIAFVFPHHTLSDIKLPAAGSLGSRISWSSSDPAHLDSEGHVHRGEKDAVVTLTASAAYGSACRTKTFSFTVLSAAPVVPRPYRNSIHAEASPVLDAPQTAAADVDLMQVSLHGENILTANEKRLVDYLLMIDADRMLYNFRRAFGQDTGQAKPLGGWEEPAGLLRGHSTGHLLSGLAYGYAATHNTALKEKADYLIRELRALQLLSKGDPARFRTACTPSHAAQSEWSKDPSCWGEGFLSAYSPDQFALLEQYTPYATIWAPYYTLHKLLAGFLDNYRLCGNQTALDCAVGIADWVCRRLSVTTKEQRAKMWSMYIAGEYGGMNESLADLALITGDHKYMDTAALFDNPRVFDGLTRNEDTIQGIHANQHIPQIIGALTEYKASGIFDYYLIARNFWHLVINHYLYSIGGVGRGEIFKEPDVLAGNIEGTRNCETCAAYNMLKLTAMLYLYEPDRSEYMDYYERALINQIAASQSPKITPKRHHGVTYMLPIGPGAEREYSNDYDDFTCCHGTGMENHVKYAQQIFHTAKECLYVNLYLPSEFVWEEQQMAFSMDTSFPNEWTKLTVKNSGHAFLKLRIPFWCRDGFSVSWKGREYLPGEENYLLIDADFAAGDVLLIHTPFSVHLCYTPDKRDGHDVASVMYGPLVMVAKSSSPDWITLSLPANPADAFRRGEDSEPVLFYEDLELIPMYRAHHMPYHTYFMIQN